MGLELVNDWFDYRVIIHDCYIVWLHRYYPSGLVFSLWSGCGDYHDESDENQGKRGPHWKKHSLNYEKLGK